MEKGVRDANAGVREKEFRFVLFILDLVFWMLHTVTLAENSRGGWSELSV